MVKLFEPTGLSASSATYCSDISRAMGWYHREKDKKEARQYLRSYLDKDQVKIFDKVPDNKISLTYCWMARMLVNGNTFKDSDIEKLNTYIKNILAGRYVSVEPTEVVEVVERASVRDYLEDKIKDYIGELEGKLDECISSGEALDLYKDMQARNISNLYCSHIEAWVRRKAGEFVFVYETTDPVIKEAYSNFTKRKITFTIKMLSAWLEAVTRYSQFKRANRKPRVKKAKPPGKQIARLKYMKEDTVLGIKSINPVELVGASQAWIFNTKYKKLAVYRSESRDGLQIKGSSLQNYTPEQCEQKGIRKPQDFLKKVMESGKLALRKILQDVPTKDTPVTGRINEDCLILRVIK